MINRPSVFPHRGGSRFTVRVLQFAVHALRFTSHAARFTLYVSLNTGSSGMRFLYDVSLLYSCAGTVHGSRFTVRGSHELYVGSTGPHFEK